MDCPSCQKRELALVEKVGLVVPVPDNHDRLWCPACGYVTEVPVKKQVIEPAAKVPRGTARKTGKAPVKKARRAKKGPIS